jgi:hypothetical protein
MPNLVKFRLFIVFYPCYGLSVDIPHFMKLLIKDCDMKKLLVLPILLFSISCFADVYSGVFSSDRNSISLKYTFDASNKTNLKGTFEGTRTGKMLLCWQGIRSIDGSKIDGVDVTLIAPAPSSQDAVSCGDYKFIGKVDGNKFIGKFT